jgi:hypothetical protein
LNRDWLIGFVQSVGRSEALRLLENERKVGGNTTMGSTSIYDVLAAS